MQKDDQGTDAAVIEAENPAVLAVYLETKVGDPTARAPVDLESGDFVLSYPKTSELSPDTPDPLLAEGISASEEVDPKIMHLPNWEEHMAMVESGERKRRLDFHRERLAKEASGESLLHVTPNAGISPSSMERVHLDVTPSNKTTTKDVRQALEMAAVSLDSLDGSDAGARAQAVMKALAAVKQLEKNQLRKRIKFWLGWFVFFALLGGMGYGGWQWAKPQLATGRYTVPVKCKMEYAGEEMEVRRNFTYPFKSLFGYHLVDEGAVEIEDEVVLQGDKLTILGIKNGRTWRKDYAKGEFGTAKLPNTDIYWFVGEKAKDTKAVTFNTFCN